MLHLFNKFPHLFSLILFVFLIIRIVTLSPPLSDIFAQNYHYETLENVYLNSQYIQEHPKGSIPDQTVYAYAAGNYLREGSPILVDPSQPPFGKYIIATAIALFGNTGVSTYVFFLLFLLAYGMVAFGILGNVEKTLIATILITFEPLVTSQLVSVPLLDIFQITFLMFAFYFFMRWIEKKMVFYILVAACMVGLVAVTKFFITAIVMLVAWSLYLMLHKQWKQLLTLFIAAGIATFGWLLISYSRVILESGDPFQVIGIQFWILSYHSSKLTSIGTVWPLVFFNRWQTWWGEKSISSDPQWWVGWPIVFGTSFVLTIKSLLPTRKHTPLQIILLWIVVYSLFITFAQASSRYLLPVIPFTYIATFYAGDLLLRKLNKRYRFI